jgi:hypothetical protein
MSEETRVHRIWVLMIRYIPTQLPTVPAAMDALEALSSALFSINLFTYLALTAIIRRAQPLPLTRSDHSLSLSYC